MKQMKKLTYKGIINLQIFLIILLITFGFVVSKNIVNVTNKQFLAPGSAAATSATDCDKFKIEDLYNINAELSDNARKLEISVKPDYPDKKVREELKKSNI